MPPSRNTGLSWASFSREVSLLGEAPLVPGADGLLVGEEGEAVLFFPGDLVHFCQVFGGFPHAFRAVKGLHFGVNQAPAQGGVVHHLIAGGEGPFRLGYHKGSPGHGLHPAPDVDLAFPCPDGPHRLGHCLQTRSAEAVDRAPRHFHGETRQEEGHAGHVAVVFSGLVGAAGVDVLHLLLGDPASFHEGGEGEGQEIVGAHTGQGSPVLADGGSEGFHNPGFGHGTSLPTVR